MKPRILSLGASALSVAISFVFYSYRHWHVHEASLSDLDQSIHTSSFSIPVDDAVIHGSILQTAHGNRGFVLVLPGSGRISINDGASSGMFYSELVRFLLSHGFRVIEFDKRGVGQSTGTFESASIDTFIRDAEAVLDFSIANSNLHLSRNNIGVVGHSEGGLIACRIARERVTSLGFVVLFSAPLLKGSDFVALQLKREFELSGIRGNRIAVFREIEDLVARLQREPNEAREAMDLSHFYGILYGKDALDPIIHAQINMQIRSFLRPWTLSIMKTDPIDDLESTRVAVFAAFTELDALVPAEANISHYKNTASDRLLRDTFTTVVPSLDHFYNSPIALEGYQQRKVLFNKLDYWLTRFD